MKCMICSLEKASRGIPCKLCGMRTSDPVKSHGYRFCCDGCSASFNRILKEASSAEREELLMTEVVI